MAGRLDPDIKEKICEDETDSVDVYFWKLSRQSKYYVVHPLMTQYTHFNQGCITPFMRQRVLEWLVEINCQFNFTLDTICVTANLLGKSTDTSCNNEKINFKYTYLPFFSITK